MKQDVKAEWVAALRSGEYNQTTHNLRDLTPESAYCCLGVLCDIAKKHGVVKETIPLHANYSWFGNAESTKSANLLPIEVMSWAGLDENDPNVPARDVGEVSLTFLNDTGYSFTDIANIIEENL